MHDHKHSLTVDPKDLTPGSVLVTTELEKDLSPVVSTRRGIIDVLAHDGAEQNQNIISPIEHVLCGLALCISQTLKMEVTQKQMKIHKLFVAVSQKREGSQTHIINEIIVDGHLSDEDKDALKKATDNCPVQKILSGDMSFETVLA